MHEQILGHLLGALDDDEHESIDARLEHDDECIRELIRWRRRLAPLEMMRPDYEPPPGLAERTCRFVEASMPAAGHPQGRDPRRRMSSRPIPPSRIGRLGWLDVAAVAMLLVTAVAVIMPAIGISRFESRLAFCQDGLRQFGLALSQYGQDQRNMPGQLASHGRLTRAGVFAAKLLRDDYFADDSRNVCPDAWLAAQGVLRRVSCVAKQPEDILPRDVWGIDDPYDDWPGMLRNGTTDGWQLPPSPAAMPLLADAPSADLPGQDPLGHGGLGRNVFFEDGRVGFRPTATSVDKADWHLAAPRNSAASGISAPIILVSGGLR